MILLWIFVGVCPVAFGVLFAFASRVDPLSGRLQRGQRRSTQAPRHCLQRTTIDRFLTFAPNNPPSDPPAVAPLSTSFEITS